MSKHWKEKTNPEEHIDYMSTSHIGGFPIQNSSEKGEWVYFVRECSFTFQFASIDQLKVAKAYFSMKVHPSTKRFNNGLEHYWQSWFERLPAGLIRGTKRVRILKALEKALQEFSPDQPNS
ncbi:hypothetical protein [Fluviicola sp.]|uniref:hypothetical protein n=1 Tax=Fluviicola sp. TaxID=1917219 RepID=UPI0031E0DAA7